MYSNLYTYKASECKCTIIRLTVLLLSLHCGTWDMYPVAVPLNAHASIVRVYMYAKKAVLYEKVGINTDMTYLLHIYIYLLHVQVYVELQLVRTAIFV